MPRLFLGPTGSADDAFPTYVCELLSAPPATLSPAVRSSPLYNAIARHAQNPRDAGPQAERRKEMPPPRPAVVPSSVARRGLGPSDPLLQRKWRRQQRQEKAKAAPAESAACAGHSVTHWSRRLLREMTRTGWDVFREQIGIQLEIVSRRASSNAATAASSPRIAPETTRPIRCWAEAELPLALGTVVSQRFPLPSPVQSQCVPLALRGRVDVLGVAETGSGKTAAYLVPVLAEIVCRCPRLLGDGERIAHGPFALVAVPTRELAEQITQEALGIIRGGSMDDLCRLEEEEEAKEKEGNENGNAKRSEDDGAKVYTKESAGRNRLSDIRVVKIVGGERMEDQFESLSHGAHIVIGTLGQLDALLQQRMLALGNTCLVVLDEADRMIEEKQTDALVAVLERCPVPRQTLMFTATLSPACEELALKYFSPEGFVVVRIPQRCAGITQVIEPVPSDPTTVSKRSRALGANAEVDDAAQREDSARSQGSALHGTKFARLVSYLCYAAPPIVVFANEKRTCDALQTALRAEAERLAGLVDSFPLSALVGDIPCALQTQSQHKDQTSHRQHSNHSMPHGQRRAAGGLSSLRSVATVHSELSQAERRRVVESFHRGERLVLVTTDLLARGLDVPNVSLVINYDMPRVDAHTSGEEAVRKYIHRIGRTGRAGASGVAVSFLSLPANFIHRAEQHVERSRARAQNSTDSTKDIALRMAFVSEKAVARAAEARELLGTAGDRERAESDLLQSDEEEDEEEDTGEPPRSRARVEATKESAEEFPNDKELLQSLWTFLVHCAEANGGGSGAEAIRQQRCRQLQVPQSLVALMNAFTQRLTNDAIRQ